MTKTDYFDSEYDYPTDVDTGLTPFDFFSVLMYAPANTKSQTKDGEEAMKYMKEPITSWPVPPYGDRLTTIDKVEISLAYKCDIGQELMIDYVHINRISTLNRLENITEELQNDITEKIESYQVLSGEMEEVKIEKGKIENLEKDLCESNKKITNLFEQMVDLWKTVSTSNEKIYHLSETNMKNNNHEKDLSESRKQTDNLEKELSASNTKMGILEEKVVKMEKLLQDLTASARGKLFFNFVPKT